MSPEKEQILYKKYPTIFRQKDLPMTETCMCWGIDTGDGWFTLIDDLCDQIMRTGIRVEAVQVKEKFGGLRFYFEPYDDQIGGLVSCTEAKSYTICDMCGGPGIPRKGGWVVTRCNKCYARKD